MKRINTKRRQVIEDKQNFEGEVDHKAIQQKGGKPDQRRTQMMAQGIITRNFFDKDKEEREQEYDKLQVVQAKGKEIEGIFKFALEEQQEPAPIAKEEEVYQPSGRQIYLFDEEPENPVQPEPTGEPCWLETELHPSEEQGNAIKQAGSLTSKSFECDEEQNSINTPRRLKAQSKPTSFLVVDDFGEENEADQPILREYIEKLECIRILKHIPEGTCLQDFLSRAVPKGSVLQCCLRRQTSDIASPCYSLYINNTYRHLVSAKKKLFCATSNYILSTDRQHFDSVGPTYLGKCRSNFLGTQFNGYHPGNNPDKSGDRLTVRANIVTVKYQSNFFGGNGPRKMEIFAPKPLADGDVGFIRPTSNQQNLESSKYSQSVDRFINKPPEWDDRLDAYVLNFNGRVTKASIKNFLIVDQSTKKTRLLFGRLAKNVFSLDIEYPFTVLQAMCIVLSSFDRKLACQ